MGVYHPRMKGKISGEAGHLPRLSGSKARVGVLLMRSYVLANNAQHYDGVIQALEARGHVIRDGDGGFGGYQGILRDPDTGVYFAASESRKDGDAGGY